MEYKEISRGDLLNLSNKVMKGMKDENESDLDLELEELEGYKELARRLPKYERKNLENLLKFFNEDGSFKKMRRTNLTGSTEVERLERIKPNNYVAPINKLINTMIDDERVPYDGSEFDLVGLYEGNRKLDRTITINYETDAIQISEKDKRFKSYDRHVHEAICSLYEAGNTRFTADQVYRAMNGLDRTTVSDKAAEEVTKSIDKMRRMQVTINYSEEFRKTINSEDDKDYFAIEGYVISADKINIRAGGKNVIGYRMIPKPIIYEYAQTTKQVLTVPMELLNTTRVINTTSEVTIIRGYLIRRIGLMKNTNNRIKSKNILFDTVYKQVLQDKPSDDKAKKIRNTTDKILDHFKELGYIKDFEFYKLGRSFKGIEIYL